MRSFVMCFCLIIVFCAITSAEDDLYKAILTSKPANLPAGLTVTSVLAITDFQIEDKNAGLNGEVEIKFAGGDEKTFINYYFFSNADAAAGYDKKYFEDLHPGKELTDPAGAQCSHFGNEGGYCDLALRDLSIVITSRGHGTTADALMKAGYDHLMSIAKPSQTQP